MVLSSNNMSFIFTNIAQYEYRYSIIHDAVSSPLGTPQPVMPPLNLKSRLLAPTKIPIMPCGLTQPCCVVFQMDKSYLDKFNATIPDCPGSSKERANPLSTEGEDSDEAGNSRYSCDTYPKSQEKVDM